MSELAKNVSNRTFEELFRIQVQFKIPFFQRGYVWNRDNWKQLFDDIKEQIDPEIESLENISKAEHFFGPIVVLEEGSNDLDLRKFLVIDGQQRITTIYLLLAVIKRKIESKLHQSSKAPEYCNELDKFIQNEVREKNEDDYNQLKVLSSKGDRLPTYLLIYGTNPNTPSLQSDQQLYIPERNQIDALKKYLDRKLYQDFDDVPSLWRLSQILLKSLKIVWIGLDKDKDDPQAIFESLNDRGTPLTASELICSYLFKPLMESKDHNHEELHNQYWLDAIGKVDLSSSGFEDYLRIHFSIDEKKVIGKGRRIYVHFKNKNKALTTEKAINYLKDIKSSVDVYNQIMNPTMHKNKNYDITELLIKIKSTRMEACNTFLLALLKAGKHQTMSDDLIISVLKETLTLLVRRKMGELSTTRYDTIFPNMLSKIVNEPDPVKAFRKKILNDEYYVSDQEFENALVNKPLYRTKDLSFTRMILQEIDKSMQSYGQFPDYSTLETVEHVLPQTLTKEWKNYIGNDATDNNLKLYTDTLGNLCLLSQPANSHAGQDPFEAKKKDYTDVSALTVDLKKRCCTWNIEAIKTRGNCLSQEALKIWAWSE